jgi:hypothetical protein
MEDMKMIKLPERFYYGAIEYTIELRDTLHGGVGETYGKYILATRKIIISQNIKAYDNNGKYTLLEIPNSRQIETFGHELFHLLCEESGIEADSEPNCNLFGSYFAYYVTRKTVGFPPTINDTLLELSKADIITEVQHKYLHAASKLLRFE